MPWPTYDQVLPLGSYTFEAPLVTTPPANRVVRYVIWRLIGNTNVCRGLGVKHEAPYSCTLDLSQLKDGVSYSIEANIVFECTDNPTYNDGRSDSQFFQVAAGGTVPAISPTVTNIDGTETLNFYRDNLYQDAFMGRVSSLENVLGLEVLINGSVNEYFYIGPDNELYEPGVGYKHIAGGKDVRIKNATIDEVDATYTVIFRFYDLGMTPHDVTRTLNVTARTAYISQPLDKTRMQVQGFQDLEAYVHPTNLGHTNTTFRWFLDDVAITDAMSGDSTYAIKTFGQDFSAVTPGDHTLKVVYYVNGVETYSHSITINVVAPIDPVFVDESRVDLITQLSDTYFGYNTEPVISPFEYNGAIYYVDFTRLNNSGSVTRCLRISKSEDNGATWAAISTGSAVASVGSYYSNNAVFSNGAVHFYKGVLGSNIPNDTSGNKYQVGTVVSFNLDTETWSTSAQSTELSTNLGTYFVVAARPNGQIVVVGQGNYAAHDDLRYNHSFMAFSVYDPDTNSWPVVHTPMFGAFFNSFGYAELSDKARIIPAENGKLYVVARGPTHPTTSYRSIHKIQCINTDNTLGSVIYPDPGDTKWFHPNLEVYDEGKPFKAGTYYGLVARSQSFNQWTGSDNNSASILVKDSSDQWSVIVVQNNTGGLAFPTPIVINDELYVAWSAYYDYWDHPDFESEIRLKRNLPKVLCRKVNLAAKTATGPNIVLWHDNTAHENSGINQLAVHVPSDATSLYHTHPIISFNNADWDDVYAYMTPSYIPEEEEEESEEPIVVDPVPTPPIFSGLSGPQAAKEPIRLIWKRNEIPCGLTLYFPIGFGNELGQPIKMTVSSNTHRRGTYETFRNIYLFLSGTEEMITEIGTTWPELYNCGLQMSLDGGLSWITFRTYSGINIPDLGPFDKHEVSVRLKTPPMVEKTGLKEVFLDVECDLAAPIIPRTVPPVIPDEEQPL
jgi:hypothetical protein